MASQRESFVVTIARGRVSCTPINGLNQWALEFALNCPIPGNSGTTISGVATLRGDLSTWQAFEIVMSEYLSEHSKIDS